MEYLLDEVKLDPRLANHIASIFVRDPIPSFSVEIKNTPCQFELDGVGEEMKAEVLEKIGECPVKAEPTINPDGDTHACAKCKWWTKTPPYDGNNNFENI